MRRLFTRLFAVALCGLIVAAPVHSYASQRSIPLQGGTARVVPNFVGLTSRQAALLAQQRGFQIVVSTTGTRNPAQVGRVLRQSHAPGTVLQSRFVVVVFVGQLR